MELMQVTPDNLKKVHICCTIANSNDIQVISKTGWLANHSAGGLVFFKGTIRDKCFIECIPQKMNGLPFVQTSICSSTVF